MILSKVYEDAERRLERNEITLGEFERLVDIEVIEPKCGEWIRRNTKCEYRCSECGKIVFADDENELNFCCCCGSRNKVRKIKGAEE